MPPRFDLPTPDEDTQPFWDGANEHKLVIKHCNAVRRVPPLPAAVLPEVLEPRRRVVRGVEARHALHVVGRVRERAAAVPERLPYVAALIDLEEGRA